VLRDSIFINTVGSVFQPNAKILALLFCFPLTLFYTALVHWLPREKTLYFIAAGLGTLGLGFTGLLYLWHSGVITDPTLLGWSFYMFAETFDALTMAPFWAFINDITYPGEAKRGYGFIVFAAQMGGLFFTGMSNVVSRYSGGDYTRFLPLIMGTVSILLPIFAFAIWKTMHAVRRQNLVGYVTLEEAESGKQSVEPVQSSFLAGIKLLLSRPYVAGIFALTASREVIQTLMSYRLYCAIEAGYVEAASRHLFLFNYALVMQVIAVAFALFGTSYLQRKFGIRFSLIAYPIFLAVCAAATSFSSTLLIVAAAVAAAKALHYTLNKPAREVLYIPTSVDVKYKSKAWIEVFGIRLSKVTGATLNKTIGQLPYVVGGIVLGVATVWVFVAGSVGNVYNSIIKERERIE
ncbi:hypothetical protein KAU11_02735, partial [Candidatus Babeliales bacterium]|nr:hypothetical protein [Candidatus Babeliales bacterium]